jgi:DNA recombination protein RmuC
MLLYFLVVLLLFFSVITAALMVLLKSKKDLLVSTQTINTENCKKIDSLIQEKIWQAEKIQHLSTKLAMSQDALSQMDKMQSSLMQSAENTLKHLGMDLTKQLLEAHQHETKNAQIQHDQKITKAAQEIRTDVQKLVSSVKILEKEVEESSTSVKTLKNSLLSPVQSSNLTEITLNNILTKSGLTPNLDFKLQPTISDGDKTYRPDAIVFLPNAEFIIIDAKASKFFIEASFAPENKEEELSNEILLRENLVKSMNRHLKDLSEKDYTAALKNHMELGANTSFYAVTIMFLHTESVVEKINSADKSFLPKAWEKNIFPVGPSGLMNILCLTKRQIGNYRQIENYTKILESVQKLVSCVDMLASHGNKLGSDIYALTNSYDKFAASFNQNFISRTKSLYALGIESKKNQSNALKRYLTSQTIPQAQDFLEIEQETEVNTKNTDK